MQISITEVIEEIEYQSLRFGAGDITPMAFAAEFMDHEIEALRALDHEITNHLLPSEVNFPEDDFSRRLLSKVELLDRFVEKFKRIAKENVTNTEPAAIAIDLKVSDGRLRVFSRNMLDKVESRPRACECFHMLIDEANLEDLHRTALIGLCAAYFVYQETCAFKMTFKENGALTYAMV